MRLTNRYGLCFPDSEGTHSYQLLLITLKIPQLNPVTNSHGLPGGSASFRAFPRRAVLCGCTAKVNDVPVCTVR